jgi:hypothetical protein
MRRIAAVLAVVSLTGLAAISSAASASGPAPRPRVSVIGDSIVTGVMYTPQARALLGQNVDLRFLAAVCRRLVQASCWYKGTRPETALDLIQGAGASLGGTVVVESGYNEYVDEYPSDIDTIMRALAAAGVKTVLWVTLREERPSYATMNTQIRAATARWPQLVVVDWNAASRNRPWFVGDGLHLDSDGAMGMARLLRKYVVTYACGGICRRDGPPD